MAILISLHIFGDTRKLESHDIPRTKTNKGRANLLLGFTHGKEKHMKVWIVSNSFLYVSSDSEHLVNMRCDEQKKTGIATTGLLNPNLKSCV